MGKAEVRIKRIMEVYLLTELELFKALIVINIFDHNETDTKVTVWPINN